MPRVPLRLQPLPQLEPFHQPMLAHDKVRYVGEPIAVVVADTRRSRRTRTISSTLDIEPLPADDRPRSGAKRQRRCCSGAWLQRGVDLVRDAGDAAKAFDDAPYTRKERFAVQRHAAMFMEPRGFVAEWDGAASG